MYNGCYVAFCILCLSSIDIVYSYKYLPFIPSFRVLTSWSHRLLPLSLDMLLHAMSADGKVDTACMMDVRGRGSAVLTLAFPPESRCVTSYDKYTILYS
jgi:hypothetical protein